MNLAIRLLWKFAYSTTTQLLWYTQNFTVIHCSLNKSKLTFPWKLKYMWKSREKSSVKLVPSLCNSIEHCRITETELSWCQLYHHCWHQTMSYHDNYWFSVYWYINTLRPRQNDSHFHDIFQCSWIKMYEFRLRFNWNLFLRFELIFQHWFR